MKLLIIYDTIKMYSTTLLYIDWIFIGFIIILSIIINGVVKNIYTIHNPVSKSSYHCTRAPYIANDQYLSKKKYKLMNLIVKKHYEDSSQKTPHKYKISDDIRNHSRTLGIPLYWSQWKTNTNTDTRERIVIWKPPKYLKMECEQTRNKYHMKEYKTTISLN